MLDDYSKRAPPRRSKMRDAGCVPTYLPPFIPPDCLAAFRPLCCAFFFEDVSVRIISSFRSFALRKNFSFFFAMFASLFLKVFSLFPTPLFGALTPGLASYVGQSEVLALISLFLYEDLP